MRPFLLVLADTIASLTELSQHLEAAQAAATKAATAAVLPGALPATPYMPEEAEIPARTPDEFINVAFAAATESMRKDGRI